MRKFVADELDWSVLTAELPAVTSEITFATLLDGVEDSAIVVLRIVDMAAVRDRREGLYINDSFIFGPKHNEIVQAQQLLRAACEHVRLSIQPTLDLLDYLELHYARVMPEESCTEDIK